MASGVDDYRATAPGRTSGTKNSIKMIMHPNPRRLIALLGPRPRRRPPRCHRSPARTSRNASRWAGRPTAASSSRRIRSSIPRGSRSFSRPARRSRADRWGADAGRQEPQGPRLHRRGDGRGRADARLAGRLQRRRPARTRGARLRHRRRRTTCASPSSGKEGRYAWVEPVELKKPSIGGAAHPAGIARHADDTLWVTSTRGNTVQLVNVGDGHGGAGSRGRRGPLRGRAAPRPGRCYVTNWGGDPPKEGDLQANRSGTPTRVDARGHRQPGDRLRA